MLLALNRATKSILFFTPYGYWQVHNQLDLAVASAAKLRGCRITYVTCNARYQPCAMNRGQVDCETCQGAMEQIAAPFAICGEPLGALMTAEEIEKAETWVERLDDGSLNAAVYEDFEVGDWALSTVMTHFRIGDLADLRRPAVVKIHRRFLRDTLLTYQAVGRVIERDRIDAVFLFNGRFYPYRAAFEASRRKGLQVLVHERGRIANSFCFFENENCLSSRTGNALVAAWAHRPLDDGALQQIDQHFSQLLRGRSANWPSFYDQVQSGDPRKILDIPADATIVAFFSSSSDEIAAQISFAKVTSQFTLIEKIAAILEEAGIYLIVRHHPHIGGGPVGSPVEPSAFFETYLRTRSRRSNVRVVMPKDDLASYAIFPYLKAAVAPFTSLGLEATAFGIPTLVAKGAISSFDARYTIDDWSVETLKRKLAFVLSPDAALDGERLRTFYRTFYSRFHRFSMRFNAVSIKDFIKPSVHADFADALQPNEDRSLDRVMDFLFERRDLYERPDPDLPPAEVSELSAENEHIAVRLKAIEARSHDRKPEMPKREPEYGRKQIAILCEEPRGPSLVERLTALPNSDRVSIVPFHPEVPSIWRRLWTWVSGPNHAVEFGRWSGALLFALDGVAEDRVLVISERHQLHDASIATILAQVERTDTGRPTMLSGWFGDADRFNPVRVGASTLGMPQWHDVRSGRPDKLRGQDVLSLCVVDKGWLRANLNSATDLQCAFFAETSASHDVSSAAPVWMWHEAFVDV